MFKKNVAGQFIHFQGVDATTAGIKSGVTWTVRRCIDGTFAAATGTATEDGTTGWYKFALSQADTNGNNIGFNFTGTGAVPQTVNIITDGAPPDVNVAKFGTTTVTGRDIGASVLLSAGTGTGQLDFTSGVVKSSLVQILGTALTETAGQIAAAFKQFFDVATPTGTMKAITNVVTTTNLTTNNDKTGYSLTATTGLGNQTANITGNLSGSVGSVTTVSDKTGYSLTATTGLGNQTANITGNLSGSVGSVTGAVGSVTGAVGSVTNAVTISAGTGAGQLDFTSGVVKANLTQILGTALTETAGQIAAGFKQFFNIGSPTSTMNTITTVTTTTTATNLTNAPANGDLTATMKTSVTTAASAATPALSAGGVTAVQSGLATSAELAKVPKSDSTVSWNATALAAIATNTQTGMTAQGYTSTRAGYLDTLNGLVAAIWANVSRTLTSGAAPSVASIVAGVWDEAISGHLTAGSTGNALNSAGSAGDPWGTSLPGAYGAGSAGNIIGNNLNATVSSRSTYAGADTSGTTTLLGRIIGTLAAGTHNPQTGDAYAIVNNGTYGNSALHTEVAKDATVSKPGTAQTITAPADMALNSTVAKDATVMKSASYTAPDNASVTAIKAKTDNLPASPAAVGSAMTLTAAYDAAKTAATQASVTALNNLSSADVVAAISTSEPIDTNVTKINGATVTGDGTLANPWGPQ
jgi:hypothetical protein